MIRPPIATVNPLRLDILKMEEAFRALEREWDEFHAAVGGTVFQSFNWLWIWWQTYSNPSEELHIVTVRIDGRLAAILPLYHQRIGYRPIGLDRLRMIGVYETYGEYSILLDPSRVAESTQAIADTLSSKLKGPGCDLVSFFRFDPDDAGMRALRAELRARGLYERFVAKVIPRVMMDLPSGWDEYFAKLSANERDLIRRKSKALEKHGAEIEVVSAVDASAFEDYVRLHGATWKMRGSRGYFASPRFREFLRSVTDDLMSKGQARLYFLKKDGVRFAAVHAFFVNGTCCFYLSGLDRVHPLSNLSPGRVLLARVIRDAIEMGFSVFDFQGGDEEYKFRLGGKSRSFAKAIYLPRDHQGAKVLLFLAFQTQYQNLRWRLKEQLLPRLRTLPGIARGHHPPPRAPHIEG